MDWGFAHWWFCAGIPLPSTVTVAVWLSAMLGLLIDCLLGFRAFRVLDKQCLRITMLDMFEGDGASRAPGDLLPGPIQGLGFRMGDRSAYYRGLNNYLCFSGGSLF